MTYKYSDNLIDELIQRNDIVDIISQHVSLKKTGKNHKGLCPFHNEKTPSFVVSEDKQLYHCFGCGAAGNAINFIMNIENLDFMDAVELLAERSNMDISNHDNSYDKEKYNKKKELYKINREAGIYFYRNLSKGNNPAIKYLKNRGLTQDIIKRFGLGYANDSWEDLNRHLLSKGFSQNDIHESGLVISRKDNKGFYDRFRNRVIFPIFSTTKKVIGFGGRVLDDSLPKYLNSPESIIFNKGSILYGLNLARNELGDKKQLIVVEGYTDVTALYQFGIKNTVATLGTALTQNHGELFKRYCDEVIIAYDSDSAGEAATLRGLDILDQVGCKVKVITLDKGTDPDEYIRIKGVQSFKTEIERALPLIDYKIELLKNNSDINTNEGKISFIKNTIGILKNIKSPVQLDVYVNKIANETGVPVDVIKAEINGNNRDKNYFNDTSSRQYSKSNYNKQSQSNNLKPVIKIEKKGPLEIEKMILSLSMINKSIFSKVNNSITLDDLQNKSMRNLFVIIKEAYEKNSIIDKDFLIDNSDIDSFKLIQDMINNSIPHEDIDKAIKELSMSLKKYKVENKITSIKSQIKDLELKENKDERDVKKIKQLCVNLIELEKQLIKVT